MTDFNRVLQGIGVGSSLAATFAGPLDHACVRFGINTPDRQAAFLAQTAHECGMFQRLVENLNYSAVGLRKTWPARFNEADALAYARKPERIANRAYGGRNGNGNEASGDGWKFIGRGAIQITGRSNYAACGAALGLDLIAHPELLEQPDHACMSAAWFWKANGCNELADAGLFEQIGRKINGGTNGADERRTLWIKARKAMGL